MSREQCARSMHNAHRMADSQKTRHPSSFGKSKRRLVGQDPDTDVESESENAADEW